MSDPPHLGAHIDGDILHVRVWSAGASALWLCLFDGERETRVPMARGEDAIFAVSVAGRPGQRYGLRADGPWAPEQGLWFDPEKLLVDPYAVEFDRRFAYDARLSLPRGSGIDTAPLVPKAVVTAHALRTAPPPPLFRPGGLIYELNVRGFTLRHPDVPRAERGSLKALAHPAVIAHLQRLRVSAVELMPITAWIDEAHLARRGLRNAWGYNPVTMMALDARLVPGGVAELAATVQALRDAGIGVILDLVFNHTGEGDAQGPTLSMRGLDNLAYYAHEAGEPGRLVNDTGCGNTLACHAGPVRALVLDSLRHFASLGVDGFRFDLAPVLARGPDGFDPQAPIFAEIAADPLLADRVMIAEPWDVGPDGYQLGGFPRNWLEWNDKYRDDVRRFWRGDAQPLGLLATRLSGSADVFRTGSAQATRSLNYIASHDGFTLADLVAYEHRHNAANGEDNCDGQGENFSWNGGAEGASDDPQLIAGRSADARALLATLFASRGSIMLCAGDEFGRTQGGNNNAYAQDNDTTWLDWEGRDLALEGFVAGLAAFRAAHPELGDPSFLDLMGGVAQVGWLDLEGAALDVADWNAVHAPGLTLRLTLGDGRLLTLRLDRATRTCTLEQETDGWCSI